MNKRINWFFAIAVSLSLILSGCATPQATTETIQDRPAGSSDRGFRC
jgi:hypothetical protein